jgi:autotransporter-associated beta strand protein
VGVTKTGDGKWIVTGNNTYTGETVVDDGILSITNAFLANESAVRVNGEGVLDLDFSGIDVIGGLFLGGIAKATGTWGAVGNTNAMFQSSFFTGAGLLEVTAAPVPVPGDYNENGIVDAADFVLWRKSVGPGSLPNEGGISPGVVDDADYNFWRSRFGATDGAGAALGSSAVPEPASALLAVVALGLAGVAGRRRVAGVRQ